jgi:retron-type reverse transcriptase
MFSELCWKPGISHIKEISPLPAVREGKDTKKNMPAGKENCFEYKLSASCLLNFYCHPYFCRSGSTKKDKDNFLRERDHLMHEVEMLKGRLTSALTIEEDSERKNSALDLRCKELTQELEVGTK